MVRLAAGMTLMLVMLGACGTNLVASSVSYYMDDHSIIVACDGYGLTPYPTDQFRGKPIRKLYPFGEGGVLVHYGSGLIQSCAAQGTVATSTETKVDLLIQQFLQAGPNIACSSMPAPDWTPPRPRQVSAFRRNADRLVEGLRTCWGRVDPTNLAPIKLAVLYFDEADGLPIVLRYVLEPTCGPTSPTGDGPPESPTAPGCHDPDIVCNIPSVPPHEERKAFNEDSSGFTGTRVEVPWDAPHRAYIGMFGLKDKMEGAALGVTSSLRGGLDVSRVNTRIAILEQESASMEKALSLLEAVHNLMINTRFPWGLGREMTQVALDIIADKHRSARQEFEDLEAWFPLLEGIRNQKLEEAYSVSVGQQSISGATVLHALEPDFCHERIPPGCAERIVLTLVEVQLQLMELPLRSRLSVKLQEEETPVYWPLRSGRFRTELIVVHPGKKAVWSQDPVISRSACREPARIPALSP